MNRILYLIESWGPGGAERVVLNLATGLNRSEYYPIVGVIHSGWLYDEMLKRGVQTTIIPTGGSYDFKLLYYLITLIRRQGICLVHSHLMDMNFYSSIAAKIVGIPHIATEHGDIHHTSKNSQFGFKPKAISSFSTKLVFVSKFTQGAFLKRIGLDGRKTEVIYNGIDLEVFHREIDTKKKRAELGIEEDDFVVGNIGNLYPVKGQTYLLQAASKVIQRTTNAKFMIIGRGELENKLKEEVKNLNLRNHVLFLGFREDTHELLKVMDIFVLPSLSEGMPLSLIEAMACSLPTIASDVGGISEVITDGLTGFIIPPADPETLADRIIYLLENPQSASKMSKRALQKVKTSFDLQTMINNYCRIYEEVTSRL